MDLPAQRPRTRGYDFESAYHEHFRYVWTTLGRLGVERAELEDGVQDVFVVAHRRQADYDGSCALRTWLFGISRRVASDYRRRARRHRRRVDALARQAAGAVVDEPDVGRSTDGAQLLGRFLDSLDDDKRVVFVLTELEQMTSHEVARALDLNRNTVAARLRAARHAFERYAQRVRRPTPARMLADARRQAQPPARAQHRVLGLVLARVEAGATVASGAGALAGSGTVKAAVVSVTIAAGVLGAIRLGAGFEREPEAPAAASATHGSIPRVVSPLVVFPDQEGTPTPVMGAEPPVASLASVAVAPQSSSSPERGAAVRRRLSASVSSEATAPADDLRRQSQQLQQARAALHQGDPSLALALASAYARAFPAGLYHPEFALVRVRALCAQGQVAQARGEASVLRRRFPGSVVVARAQSVCPGPEATSTSP
ncbi:MAG: sigma-70 family RNA polymerase sigma factor [Myxococcota bacterium]